MCITHLQWRCVCVRHQGTWHSGFTIWQPVIKTHCLNCIVVWNVHHINKLISYYWYVIYVYCFLCCPHGAKNWLTSRECKYYVYCLIVYPDILFWWHLHCILKSFGLVTAFLQMGSQFKSSHWHQYDSGWNLLIRCDSSNCAVNMIFIWVDFLLVLYLSQHHLFISTAFNHRIKTLSEYLLNDCHDRVFFFF